MFNVAIKHFSVVALATLIASGSCGNSGKGSPEALAMLEEARNLSETALFDSSIVIIDSLCKSFPAETDIVKEAMHLKAVTMEKSFTAQLSEAEHVIADNAPIVQEIGADFTKVKTPDMVEGYRILKSIAGKELINRTDIEPRIDDGGNLYIVSLLNGHAVEHNRLRASIKGGEAAETAAIPYDKYRNYRFSDNGVTNEMVTFHYDECADFCRFIAANADADITLSFVGKSTFSMPLSPSLKHAIAKSFKYSTAIRAGLDAEKAKLLLSKKIEIAKRQIERTKPQED